MVHAITWWSVESKYISLWILRILLLHKLHRNHLHMLDEFNISHRVIIIWNQLIIFDMGSEVVDVSNMSEWNTLPVHFGSLFSIKKDAAEFVNVFYLFFFVNYNVAKRAIFTHGMNVNRIWLIWAWDWLMRHRLIIPVKLGLLILFYLSEEIPDILFDVHYDLIMVL